MEKAGATYETQQLAMLATDLREYEKKEIWYARVPNLTWTHFRHLLRVQDEKASNYYMHEAFAYNKLNVVNCPKTIKKIKHE